MTIPDMQPWQHTIRAYDHYNDGVQLRTIREPRPTSSTEVLNRFWRYVDQSQGERACWFWTQTAPGTYGRVKEVGGLGAHTFSFCLHNGPVTDGFRVFQICKNPTCVNPLHLYAVDPNMYEFMSNLLPLNYEYHHRWLEMNDWRTGWKRYDRWRLGDR